MRKEETRFVESTVFEGVTSIRAVLNAGDAGTNDRRVQAVLHTEKFARKEGKFLGYLKRRAETEGFKIRAVSEEEINSLTLGNTHGGIIARCTERTIPTLSLDLIKENGFYVMLDGIEDPYNFGYALRSLYAFGVDGVILPERSWMSAAGVVCRSSAGASELFSMASAECTAAAALMKQNGYKIVCADIEESVSVLEADLTTPLFLIVGGEKRGISRAVLSMADQIVRLDYGREFKASLSAASAATVLGYEVLRQNQGKIK